MGPQFFETMIGKKFLEQTAPQIAKNLGRIADALEKDDHKCDAQAFSPEAIKKINDTFWENHETLVNLKAVYENSDAGEDPEQSFEQGYENGMQYVCEMLGLKDEDIHYNHNNLE